MDRSSPPHILLLMTDQQRWDTLGALGFPHVLTPHLDSLVRRGVAFTNAYVQGAICGPSRASLVTGQYVHAHGAEGNETWPDASHPNWIEALRTAGYHTANIGKMHTAPIYLPCGFDYRWVVENKNYMQGVMGPPDDFDKLLAERGLLRPAQRYAETVPDWYDYLQAAIWPYDDDLYPDNVIGRRTLEYLERHDWSQPLFFWAGFVGPHDPYDVPASALERYADVAIPDPVGFPGEAETKPASHRRAMEQMDGWTHPAAIWWSRATPERVRRMRRHYYANISLIDDWVGRIVALLERRGVLDNTLIVFTSDHGDCLGDHGNVYKFSTHYDAVAKTPLVLAGPGIPARGPMAPLVEQIDLGPTLLELAGADRPEGMQSVSLAPLPNGDTTALHEAVFSEHLPPRLMVRAEEWKLVHYPQEPDGELYNLAEDPDELHNLYADPAHRSQRQELEERLLNWLVETRRRT